MSKKQVYFFIPLLFFIISLMITGTTLAEDGLIAYYPFNGNANDESINSNNGIVNGATLVSDRFGNANSAYQFDGVDDYIEINNHPSINVYDEFTVLAWIKTNVGGNIVSKQTYRDCGGYRSGWRIRSDAFASRFGVGTYPDDTLPLYVSDANVNDDSWHLVGVTWNDSTDTVKLYVDGIKVLTQTESGQIASNSNNLYIGTFQCYTPASYFEGLIDDVMIYNRELSDNEINVLYDPLVNLVGYFPFNGNANDESGYENDGVVHGATLTTDRHGISDSAYQFDGVDDYINFGDNNYLENSSKFTISLWVSFDAFSSASDPSNPILCKWYSSDTSGRNSYYLYEKDGNLTLKISNGTLNFDKVDFAHNLSLDQWYQLSIVFNEGTIDTYVNGTSIGTYTSSVISAIGNIDEPLKLGDWFTTYNSGPAYKTFSGKLDDLRLYATNLSTNHIKDIYDEEVPNNAPSANAQSVSVDEDSIDNVITLTGSDVNGDTLTYTVASNPSYGTLSGTAPNLLYTPNGDYNGIDSFTFSVNDGSWDSSPATVSITVNAVDDDSGSNLSDVTTSSSGGGGGGCFVNSLKY